jgi:hypothetical protein
VFPAVALTVVPPTRLVPGITPKSRLYWRNGWAYADLRSLGGPQEALRTRDPDVATKRLAERVKELEEAGRFRGLTGVNAKGLAEHAREPGLTTRSKKAS